MLVERAADGAACVELVKTHPAGYYSAVLMDIQMPVMNGYDAAKALRALPDGRGALPSCHDGQCLRGGQAACL